MTQFYTPVEVIFSDVIVPEGDEKRDPVSFANKARAEASKILKIPVTEHSYEDTFLSQAARKAHFNPADIVDFEFKSIRNLFEIDLKEAKRLLKRFGDDSAVRKTGTMNAQQFAKALRVPLSEPVLDLFALLDKDGAGMIDFKAFLIGLTFISQNATSSDGIEL